MVKLSTPLALLAVAVAGAFAQEASSSSAAPSSSSSASESSASPSAAPSSSSQAEGGSGSGASSGVCSALFEANVHQADCQYSSTTVPPYNLSSLVSYFIGEHSAGPQGRGVSEVADEMANSVIKYYPTVTASKSDIVYSFYEGIIRSISAAGHPNFKPADKIDRPTSGSASKYAVPAAAAAVAVVAGGAVLL
ncbi:hypothetical protein MBRA1_000945 [Malassezia brasiliensis]|uniref:Uncharacterized protein n=1 Tax=Malassezia brasiliensis TaxID=1821822 RepID=A0AAF0DUG9_9BASI|nr:hypothetical protein MBRA1_000945 [Malassezia brasiliensis]